MLAEQMAYGAEKSWSGDREPEDVTRPPTRWTDDLVKAAGIRWMREARDRSVWRHLGEAYVQQWTSFG